MQVVRLSLLLFVRAHLTQAQPDCTSSGCPAACMCFKENCPRVLADCYQDNECATAASCANNCECGDLLCAWSCAPWFWWAKPNILQMKREAEECSCAKAHGAGGRGFAAQRSAVAQTDINVAALGVGMVFVVVLGIATACWRYERGHVVADTSGHFFLIEGDQDS
mmetsp:Transcript_38890/g.88450  ORF Transcript_38890/g.88450 Transcript_38890/m.88450 type:complete len:166 (-) Transcript_38890:81-578(-)